MQGRRCGKEQVLAVLQVASQIVWPVVATAMRASQVAGDECITGAVCLVMLAVCTFNIFDVVTQAAHQAADETGTQCVAKFD